MLAVCLFNKTGTWDYLFVETARSIVTRNFLNI